MHMANTTSVHCGHSHASLLCSLGSSDFKSNGGSAAVEKIGCLVPFSLHLMLLLIASRSRANLCLNCIHISSKLLITQIRQLSQEFIPVLFYQTHCKLGCRCSPETVISNPQRSLFLPVRLQNSEPHVIPLEKVTKVQLFSDQQIFAQQIHWAKSDFLSYIKSFAISE